MGQVFVVYVQTSCASLDVIHLKHWSAQAQLFPRKAKEDGAFDFPD